MPICSVATRILVVLAALHASDLKGQSYVSDIVPSNTVTQMAHRSWRLGEADLSGAPLQITQTNDGYLWLIANDELLRFDGIKFTAPYKTQLVGLTPLRSLFTSADGSLWAVNVDGLSHIAGGTLENIPVKGSITRAIEDQNGAIWMTHMTPTAGSPLCKLQAQKMECEPGLPFPAADGLAADGQNNLWVAPTGAQRGSICKWRYGFCTNYFGSNKTVLKGINDVQTIVAAPDGSIWAALRTHSGEILLEQFIDGAWKQLPNPQLRTCGCNVLALHADLDGALWVGTDNTGVFRFKDATVGHFDSRDGLSGDSVRSFYRDREGTLWLATSGGLDSFRDLPVKTWTKREGLASSFYYSIWPERDGTILLARDRGWDVLSPKGVRSVQPPAFQAVKVRTLFRDLAGHLWVGTEDDLFIQESGHFRRLLDDEGHSFGYVSFIVEDASQDLWIKAHDRLYKLRGQTVLDKFSVESSSDLLRAVTYGAEGIIGGINRQGLVRVQGSHISSLPGSQTGVTPKSLVVLDGIIWYSTRGGLYAWKDGTEKQLTIESNQRQDIGTLATDLRGNLSVSTQNEIIVFLRRDLHAWWSGHHPSIKGIHLGLLDGARPIYQALGKGSGVSVTNHIFLGYSPVQELNVSDLHLNSIIPPVQIEDIVADHKHYAPLAVLTLPPYTRDISIDYTALSLAVPSAVRFRYKLEGLDSNWQDVGTRREAFYMNLRPHRYTFRVLACNNDGVWNETGKSMDIIVPPGFLQTRSFIWLSLGCVVSLFLAILKFRERQIKQEIELRSAERLMERERIARVLHDTLLQGFQMLIFRFGVVARTVAEQDPVRESLEATVSLAERALAEGRDRVRDLRSMDQTPEGLVQRVSELTREFSPVTQISIDFEVIGTPRALRPIVNEDVFLILREALWNAINHSAGSKVAVIINFGSDGLTIICRDNGCGISEELLERGGRSGHWGLGGMMERAQHLGTSLGIEANAQTGTTISFKVSSNDAYID